MHGVFYLIIYIIVRILIYNYKNTRFLKIYNKDNENNLYDVGFNYIPKMNLHYSDDILVMLPVILCIYSKINWSQFFFMLTIIFILREITTTITLLPPTPYCFENVRNKMEKNKILAKISGACNETIFSGHTSIMLLSFLFVLPKIKSNLFKIFIYIYSIITSLVIISLRGHYSIDVFLAWIICILFYISYFGKQIVKKLLLN